MGYGEVACPFSIKLKKRKKLALKKNNNKNKLELNRELLSTRIYIATSAAENKPYNHSATSKVNVSPISAVSFSSEHRSTPCFYRLHCTAFIRSYCLLFAVRLSRYASAYSLVVRYCSESSRHHYREIVCIVVSERIQWLICCRSTMQIPTMRVVVSLALVALVTAVEPEKDVKKSKGLQIGVKKRIDPDKCPVKSKKGDTLHMHYTVSTICMVTVFFFFRKLYKIYNLPP